ncbi:hypothetical protein [Parvicella tangerina]|uniref:Nucleotide-diphospho-sugar transferase domain-containing protein n=1 Tax=Parvicella tangerina TaxID=2829795 RepID=A0A916NC27_9FLAO|nr:hypothetical protein [Parvicella tangerina]CAG5084307.1 hypothetical protein CRYO30217_02432 [Parvicella tangerina]
MAIVFCTEKGRLEAESLLLAKTIRKFGGAFSNSELFSYQPRVGTEVSDRTLRGFKELNVSHIDLNLNTDHHDYAFCNKIYACNHLESMNKFDTIIFLDSDQLVLSPFEELVEHSFALGVRPVEKKGVGTAGEKDINWEYWASIFNIFDIDKKKVPVVITSQTKERILAYFNAGFVVFDGKRKLCSRWMEIFRKLFDEQLFPESGKTFLDQIALVLLSQELDAEELFVLPENYNVPLNVNTKSKWTIEREIRTVHYHRVFDGERKEHHPLDYFDFEITLKTALKEELKLTGIYPKSKMYYLKHSLNKKLGRV